MDIDKLKVAEKKFLARYPGGFTHPEMIEMAKKHKPDKMVSLARESFSEDNFKNTNDILENMIKIVSRSSMISLFEKPRFRDFVNSLGGGDRIKLATSLEKILHDDQKTGFGMIVDVLKKGNLAKWSLVTICPLYYRPTVEVFIKPTTVKNVIEYFELKNLEYKPSPTFEFYKKYRAIINTMKHAVDKTLSPDNAYFSGFLMIVMENSW